MDVARTHDSAEAAELLATGGRLRRLADDMVVHLEHTEVPPRHALPMISAASSVRVTCATGGTGSGTTTPGTSKSFSPVIVV